MCSRRITVIIVCFMLVFFAGCRLNNRKNKTTTFDQLASPTRGETIAIMNTSKGVIKMKFFPQEAPKAVENFITHSKDDYYDNLIFHRVIDGFMIQGGDSTGTGTGGTSIWGGGFEIEISDKLHHYRGALAMVKMASASGADTNASQFYIVQNPTLTRSEIEQIAADYGLTFEEAVIQKYIEVGGSPHLDGSYTIFGQVFEGMNAVDAIAGVQTGSEDKPLVDVTISDIEITTMS